jgi:hypothetical protein
MPLFVWVANFSNRSGEAVNTALTKPYWLSPSAAIASSSESMI